MEQKFDKKNQTQLYFWPQAQQIGPTQVLCYIVKDKQCNASSAICPYNTGFGVWSDDGGIVYPGNALLILSIFKIYYLEMEEV